MSVYYFDSSALVKRYCHETGSLWVRHLADAEQGNVIFTAHITGIEVVAAIARKARMSEISEPDATTATRAFRHDFQTQYQIVQMTPEIVNRAMELAEKRGLRGYDAAQMAQSLVNWPDRVSISTHSRIPYKISKLSNCNGLSGILAPSSGWPTWFTFRRMRF